MSHSGNKVFTETGSHLKFRPGPVLMTSQGEMRNQLLGVMRSATRQVTIWSRTLEQGLFEHQGFIELLKRFVLSARPARVRILIARDPGAEGSDLEEPPHPLLRIAELFPGTFDVRCLTSAPLDAAELIVVDERAVLYRIHPHRWDGMSDLNDPHVARFYLAQFGGCWQAAQPLALSGPRSE